jgi:hypothetical protein
VIRCQIETEIEQAKPSHSLAQRSRTVRSRDVSNCRCPRFSEATIRYEPPPKMKRRPCRGGASDFDPAGLEIVSMNGWIIRRREAAYKAAQTLYDALAVPSPSPPPGMAVVALSGGNRSQPLI